MHPSLLSTTPYMDHLSQPSGFGHSGSDPSFSSQETWPGAGLDSGEEPPSLLPSSYLGCSDNELIHCFFQRNEKRTFCTRAWMLFPLSASKEPGSDNQKNNSPASLQLADKEAHLTPSRRADSRHHLSPCSQELGRYFPLATEMTDSLVT